MKSTGLRLKHFYKYSVDLKHFIGLFFEKTAAELGKEGYIEIPKIIWELLTLPSQIHKFVSWQEAYKQGIVECNERHQLIVDIVKRHDESQILISIENIEHGNNILNLLKENGFQDAVFVHNKIVEREKIIQDFIQCEIRVLISSRILNMSITIPELEILVNAAGRKSMIELLQRAGRPLGKGKKPKEVKIYEIIDSHNNYLLGHSKDRMKVYKKAKYPQEGLEKFKEI